MKLLGYVDGNKVMLLESVREVDKEMFSDSTYYIFRNNIYRKNKKIGWYNEQTGEIELFNEVEESEEVEDQLPEPSVKENVEEEKPHDYWVNLLSPVDKMIEEMLQIEL